jgi:hypothetical protein
MAEVPARLNSSVQREGASLEADQRGYVQPGPRLSVMRQSSYFYP